jgi:CheY-like chemotaxis protein/predicted regulator of Ras-like GTPase activity (Roadblock/LC7/MglB family)
MPNVLIVDDSLSVRKVVEHALSPHQIDVIAAASAADAFAALEQAQPDVVICDVILPDKDGYEICAFIRAHARLGRTPVLLISGIVDDKVRERAAAVNANGVMFKPFSAETLVQKVEELLAAPGERTNERHEPDTDGIAPLARLANVPGILSALLVDREGFVIDTAGETNVDSDVAAALASCLSEATSGIGAELGHGALQSMILEYEKTSLLVHAQDDFILVVNVRDASALGKARYYVKKALPTIAREM